MLQGRTHQHALRTGARLRPERAGVLDPKVAVQMQAVDANVDQQEFLLELGDAGVRDLPDVTAIKEIMSQAFLNADSLDDFFINLNNSVPARALASKLKASVRNGRISQLLTKFAGYLKITGMDDVRWGAEISAGGIGVKPVTAGVDFFYTVCFDEKSCGTGVAICVEPHGGLEASVEMFGEFLSTSPQTALGVQIGVGKYAHRAGSSYTLDARVPGLSLPFDATMSSAFQIDERGLPTSALLSALVTVSRNGGSGWPAITAGFAHGFCYTMDSKEILASV